MPKSRFLILAGDGINCESDTLRALHFAKLEADIVHINEWSKNPTLIFNYQGLVLPGGFSFGDELGSGQILALKMRHKLSEEIKEFITVKKRPVIGICNGMQVLVKLGLLPFSKFGQESMAMAPNAQGTFVDRWVDLEINKESVCHWTRWAMDDFDKWQDKRLYQLPIRHGEGRVVFSSPSLLQELQEKKQIVLSYKQDVNGSTGQIAGLCDESGLIFGLMPHPEAAYAFELWPYQNDQKELGPMPWGPGHLIFKSIQSYLSQS